MSIRLAQVTDIPVLKETFKSDFSGSSNGSPRSL